MCTNIYENCACGRCNMEGGVAAVVRGGEVGALRLQHLQPAPVTDVNN